MVTDLQAGSSTKTNPSTLLKLAMKCTLSESLLSPIYTICNIASCLLKVKQKAIMTFGGTHTKLISFRSSSA